MDGERPDWDVALMKATTAKVSVTRSGVRLRRGTRGVRPSPGRLTLRQDRCEAVGMPSGERLLPLMHHAPGHTEITELASIRSALATMPAKLPITLTTAVL